MTENEYGFNEGDTVFLIEEPALIGIVTHIDRNLPDITTCNVIWDGNTDEDIQWTDKLCKL